MKRSYNTVSAFLLLSLALGGCAKKGAIENKQKNNQMAAIQAKQKQLESELAAKELKDINSYWIGRTVLIAKVVQGENDVTEKFLGRFKDTTQNSPIEDPEFNFNSERFIVSAIVDGTKSKFTYDTSGDGPNAGRVVLEENGKIVLKKFVFKIKNKESGSVLRYESPRLELSLLDEKNVTYLVGKGENGLTVFFEAKDPDAIVAEKNEVIKKQDEDLRSEKEKYSRFEAVKNQEIGDLKLKLAKFQNTTVPKLETQLKKLNEETVPVLESAIATYKNTTVPGLENKLKTLEKTTVPGLQQKIAVYRDTTVPGLNTQIENLENAAGETTRLQGIKDQKQVIATKKLNNQLKKLNEETVPGLESKIAMYKNTTVPGLENKVRELEGTTIPGLRQEVTVLKETTVPGLENTIETYKTKTVPGLENKIATYKNTTVPGLKNRIKELEKQLEGKEPEEKKEKDDSSDSE